MYYPTPVARPVRLLASDGSLTVYPSLIAFIATYSWYWVRQSIGPYLRGCDCTRAGGSSASCLKERSSSGPCSQERTYPFVLLDHEGTPISLATCRAAWECLRAQIRGAGRYDYWNGEGPVPYTGHHRRGSHYRAIRTAFEHRAVAGIVRSEGEPAARAARNLRNLPNGWSDRQVSARRDRSWKRYRTHQWVARRGC